MTPCLPSPQLLVPTTLPFAQEFDYFITSCKYDHISTFSGLFHLARCFQGASVFAAAIRMAFFLFICSTMDIWGISTFCLSWVKMVWIRITYTCSNPALIPRMQKWTATSCRNTVCNGFEELPRLPAGILHHQQQGAGVPASLHSQQCWLFSVLFCYSYPNCVWNGIVFNQTNNLQIIHSCWDFAGFF